MSLRLPFVLWTSPPTHDITTINNSMLPSILLTGSFNGIICVWKNHITSSSISFFVPEFIMIPSTCSPVLCIGCVVVDNFRTYIVCGL
jgi:hypothetical protein